jgi:hypothetical protein
MQPEVRLVALGVQYDVLGSDFDTLTPEQRDPVLAAHPRTNFKTGMIEALVLEATVPGYVRPNVCDAIQNSRFET